MRRMLAKSFVFHIQIGSKFTEQNLKFKIHNFYKRLTKC